jgi:adenine specific DNA methylase Mod
MFQFDENDLDFGIYRILNLKREEVERFLSNELRAITREALEEIEQQDEKRQLAEVTAFVKEKGGQEEIALLDDLEANTEQLKNFVQYKSPAHEEELLAVLDRQNGGASRADELEARVYNHVLHFFQRYYRDGDFGYNDRSLASYEVDYPPSRADYDGSDVLFHWKHKDSYYIKTSYGFHSVAFTEDRPDGDPVRIVYRLEGDAGDGGMAQKNNKEERKHYAFDRIEPVEDDADEDTYHVVFHLAEQSTPKADVFEQMQEEIFGDTDETGRAPLAAYLFEDEDASNAIFADLVGDYDDVKSGSVKGTKGNRTLRTSKEKYVEKLVKNHREHFSDLESNDDNRVAKLLDNEAHDPLAHRFYRFDKNLSTFYIGNESDYFVHEDLGRFLTRERERYVKNVIFADLDTLLNQQTDNTAVVIARAFDRVAGRITEFLAAVEEFQKNLFLLKKKVLSTDYLVSLDKLKEAADDEALQSLTKRIGENETQKQEWKEMFEVEPSLDAAQYVELHPNLPLDTHHFSERFKDDLLACFDDLEEAVDGLLLNSENLQALRLINRSFQQRIKCVYIDPPYNTGNDDFLYKDSFRHSSWLSMMRDRIGESKNLLADDASHYSQIDTNEGARLLLLLNRYFEFKREIIWDIQVLSGFKVLAQNWIRGHETIYYHSKTKDPLFNKLKQPHTEDYLSMFNRQDADGRWYMIAHGKKRYRDEVEGKGKPFGDVWDDVMSFQQQPTSSERVNFDTQKPEELLDRIIRSATDEGDWVLDYFAGSGTTPATAQKIGRKYVACESGKHFTDTLLPRIKRTLYGKRTSVSERSGYKGGGLVKYQRIEQYEDILNRLEPEHEARPDEEKDAIPLKYLYRPEQTDQVRQSVDLSRPFSNEAVYGKEEHRATLDLLETYCYLKGYRPEQKRRYDWDGKTYRAVKSGRHLVVFRPIETGEDDTEHLLHIVDDFDGSEGSSKNNSVDVMAVNHDADTRRLDRPGLNVRIVGKEAFDAGTSWT